MGQSSLGQEGAGRGSRGLPALSGIRHGNFCWKQQLFTKCKGKMFNPLLGENPGRRKRQMREVRGPLPALFWIKLIFFFFGKQDSVISSTNPCQPITLASPKTNPRPDAAAPAPSLSRRLPPSLWRAPVLGIKVPQSNAGNNRHAFKEIGFCT